MSRLAVRGVIDYSCGRLNFNCIAADKATRRMLNWTARRKQSRAIQKKRKIFTSCAVFQSRQIIANMSEQNQGKLTRQFSSSDGSDTRMSVAPAADSACMT